MKKRELKAKIAELEQSVHTWKAAFLDTSKELTRVQMALLNPVRTAFERDYPMPTTQHNEKDPDMFRQRVERVEGLMEGAFAKGRQCGGNVLAAIAGQPLVMVTTTGGSGTIQALQQWEDYKRRRESLVAQHGPLNDYELDYREGLSLGLTEEDARERASVGAVEWSRRRREEWAASVAPQPDVEDDGEPHEAPLPTTEQRIMTSGEFKAR